MRLSPSLPLSFSGRVFIHSRPFAFNAASVPAPPSHRLTTYLVPRNSRGSLPVYADIRNGGTRCLISVRNVQGNIKVGDPIPHDRVFVSHPHHKALADDLLRDLSDPKSPEPSLIKVRITGSNHLVLTGLRRKHPVLDWLIRHGF
jgi:large subunit ribosomal protein L49